VPPVIAAPHHYLISIYRNDLFFLAVVQTEGTSLKIVLTGLFLRFKAEGCVQLVGRELNSKEDSFSSVSFPLPMKVAKGYAHSVCMCSAHRQVLPLYSSRSKVHLLAAV